MSTISILEIVEDTTVDGPGFRTSVYSSGCPHHCPGCHNPQSWNIDNGHPVEIEEILKVILDDPFADVTFSGGDPMFQVDAVLELCKKVKEKSKKSIWLYSGFTIEQIVRTRYLARVLPYVDIIVDGRYVHELRNTDLPFRGSENQRIIIVDKYLKGESDYEWKLK